MLRAYCGAIAAALAFAACSNSGSPPLPMTPDVAMGCIPGSAQSVVVTTSPDRCTLAAAETPGTTGMLIGSRAEAEHVFGVALPQDSLTGVDHAYGVQGDSGGILRTFSIVAPHGALTPAAAVSCVNTANADRRDAEPNDPNPAVWLALNYVTNCAIDKRGSLEILQTAIYRLAEYNDPLHDYYLAVNRTLSHPGYTCVDVGNRGSKWRCGEVVRTRVSSFRVGKSVNATGTPEILDYQPKTVNTNVQNRLTIGGGISSSIKAGDPEGAGPLTFSYVQFWEQAAVKTTIEAQTHVNEGFFQWTDEFEKPDRFARFTFTIDPTASYSYETPQTITLKVPEAASFKIALKSDAMLNYYDPWSCRALTGICDPAYRQPTDAFTRVNVTIPVSPPTFQVSPRELKISVSDPHPKTIRIESLIPNSSLRLGWRLKPAPQQFALIDHSYGAGTQDVHVMAPDDPSLVGKFEYLTFTSNPDCATNDLEKTNGFAVRVDYVK